MPDTDKRAGSHVGSVIVFLFAFVYLFFPPVLLLPVIAVTGHSTPPPRPLIVLFSPVIYLDEHVHAYHSLMLLETAWLEQLGLR